MRLTDRGAFVLMILAAGLVLLGGALLTDAQREGRGEVRYGYDCESGYRLKEARCPVDER